jgi:hypothetical protein
MVAFIEAEYFWGTANPPSTALLDEYEPAGAGLALDLIL